MLNQERQELDEFASRSDRHKLMAEEVRVDLSLFEPSMGRVAS